MKWFALWIIAYVFVYCFICESELICVLTLSFVYSKVGFCVVAIKSGAVDSANPAINVMVGVAV
jgi:hypothetical protein